MYRISITENFDAAHRLIGYQGKCANLHGHSWKVQIFVEGKELDSRGILIDFQMIKDILKNEVLNILDHNDLNTIAEFSQGWNDNPTAENIAKYIYNKMEDVKGLTKVRVYESPDCWSEFWK